MLWEIENLVKEGAFLSVELCNINYKKCKEIMDVVMKCGSCNEIHTL